MTILRPNKGFALAVALFMLVLLTLIGITAMKLTATHSRIVGNIQDATERELAARAAIETYVTEHPTLDCGTAAIPICIPQRVNDNGVVCVAVTTNCVGRSVRNPEGGSISGGKPLYDSHWDIAARPVLGEVTEPWVHWGLMIPLSGFCPQCPGPQEVSCPTSFTCP